ncbi:hypothetical protein SNEBB_010548 [Seison nebaliae]|nr:hypothetical protein SNEBB_010548 [Seison nebaliae]
MNIKCSSILDEYHLGNEIGTGKFATVLKVTKKNNEQTDFAAKYVKKKRSKRSPTGLMREDILREIQILLPLNHENIIKLLDSFEEEKHIVLILELVKGGELFDYIYEKDHLVEKEASQFLHQILNGIDYIHKRKILHLDLKPENIMLYDKTNCQIKIIDFGISRIFDEKEPYRALFGTPEFVAPEIVAYEPVAYQSDMWAFGVITYILLSGCSPFLGETDTETFQNVSTIDYRFDDELFANTSSLAKDFIDKLFVKNVKKRSTAEDCLKHPWICPLVEEEKRKIEEAKINMKEFKQFIAKRRYKIQMHSEQRTVRTKRTITSDKFGSINEKKKAEIQGKSTTYEGEYSETDSDSEDPKRLEGSRMSLMQLVKPSDATAANELQLKLQPIRSVEFHKELEDDEIPDDLLRSFAKSSLQLKGKEDQSKENSLSLIGDRSLTVRPGQKIDEEELFEEKNDHKTIHQENEKTGRKTTTDLFSKVNRNELKQVAAEDKTRTIQNPDGTVRHVTTHMKTTRKIMKTSTSKKTVSKSYQ